jgi:hypothetical protein
MWKRLILAAICLNSVFVHAQLEGHNWVFWDSVGLSFVDGDPEIFHTTGLDPGNFVSVSDSLGVLQFITNGKYAWNGVFDLVEDSIDQGLFLDDGYQHYSSFLALPISDYVYIVYLYYNIFIISDIGIRSAIYKDNELLSIDSVLSVYTSNGGFTPIYNLRAVRHGNGKDWWLVTFGFFNITDPPYQIEVGEPFVYSTNLLLEGDFTSIEYHSSYSYYRGEQNYHELLGPFEFNPAGDKFFKAAGKHGFLYQFDRCTGDIWLLDSLIGIDSILTTQVAFSPDGSKLYLTTYTSYSGLGLPFSNSSILQYCLDCGVDIESTKDTIYQFTNNKYTFVGMKLGPDGKIYLTTHKLDLAEDDPLPDYQTHFWVINHPDSLGAACDLDTASISSGGRNLASSFPNIPNYQLGPWRASPCDTLEEFNAVDEVSMLPFKAYPNPVLDYLYIDNPLQTTCRALVYNAMGQEVERFIVQAGGQTVSTTTWPTGIYQLIIQQENSNIWKQSLVKIEPR